MSTSLLVGMEERDSAKKRRQDDYRQDLELQMRERQAARQRERLQDMSVNASGWLDPEKRPDRLKPLGGVHWVEQRGRRDERVRPYHTLFMYDRLGGMSGESLVDRSSRLPFDPSMPRRRPGTVLMEEDQEFLVSGRQTAPIRTPPGLKYHPLTYAGAGTLPNSSVDHAYTFTGARGYGGGGGSIVQPVTLPYPDNRPIIIHGGGGPYVPPTSRTVVEYRDDGSSRELRNLLGIVQSEKDRMRRDNDDFQRRLLRNMDDEKRRLHDQEEEARRRMERLRREAEENRKEAERQRREAERLRKEAEARPRSARPATPRTMIYYDMDDYRRRMMEERKRMEDLLGASNRPKGKDIWDVQILKKPRYRLNLPPTPASADKANRDNVLAFNNLKQKDYEDRDDFRQTYPDMPHTNRRLEEQQQALLNHQGSTFPGRGYYTDRPREKRRTSLEYRRSVSRPGWLDRTPTPFEHVQRKLNRKYRAFTPNSEPSPRNRGKLALRNHRPYSTDTLTDDTWIQPSESSEI